MKILIVEDEANNAARLRTLLKKYTEPVQILGTFDTVQKVVSYFQKTNEEPNVILMDIQLSDGSCFDIWESIALNIPIIFTTAFDEYAIRAFKVNGIDYLLKPIDQQELFLALNKVLKLTVIPDVSELIKRLKNRAAKRLLVKLSDGIGYVDCKDIAYLYSKNGIITVVTHANRNYIIDDALDVIEQRLDAELFFRINRSYIINLHSIESISNHFNQRFKIILKPATDKMLLTSRAKNKCFKAWLNGE